MPYMCGELGFCNLPVVDSVPGKCYTLDVTRYYLYGEGHITRYYLYGEGSLSLGLLFQDTRP
jgi:hypothetical protein